MVNLLSLHINCYRPSLYPVTYIGLVLCVSPIEYVSEGVGGKYMKVWPNDKRWLEGGGGGGGVNLSGQAGGGVGYTAWNCTERSLPCGRQAVVFFYRPGNG